MSTATLDSTTKDALRKTIRGLRERLLEDLHAATEGEYQLSVKPEKARLSEAQRTRRQRLDAWLDEQVRSVPAKEQKDARDRFRAQAEKEAAYTLLHRLVVMRQLEALTLLRPAVLTGCATDWRNSQALRELSEHAPELCQDETEGFRFLLDLVFGELALDLPGLFGDVGLTSLIPIPTQTLKAVVEAIASNDLASAWTDDTTLGWVYQYWNDPDREALDAKIARREKIAPHEIASKTQMFTERYMVEWLLQNSLGLMWLATCKKHGWTPHAERVLADLETRRIDWRKRRDAGEVALDELMPIHGELEDHWKYYVPQPLPDEMVQTAPDSIRTLKLLDPACGSGHFLVIAFDHLAALYREEAEHRRETWTDRKIVDSILANNLHGIDIDPRAVQIAAAALYLKARARVRDIRLRQLNLVAPVFRLGKLPPNDPAVVSLRADLERDAGIPKDLTDKLLSSLAGVDHLGSLLRVSAEVDAALRKVDLEIEKMHGQGDLFGAFAAQQVKLTFDEARATVLDRLEQFLAAHTSAEDLGLRLDSEQLAAGIRFIRTAKEAAYDIVVGNPPYQGLSRTEQFGYVTTTYPRGKSDLYAAFLERGVQLIRRGGASAMVTMRSWMFMGQYAELRKELLARTALPALLDLGPGAFEEISAAQVVVSVACAVCVKVDPVGSAVALRPTPTSDTASAGMTRRKRAGLLAHAGRRDFNPRGFARIDGEPLVYWWTSDQFALYAESPLLRDKHTVAAGVKTGDDVRFLRMWWEVMPAHLPQDQQAGLRAPWQYYIKGSAGIEWIEPVQQVLKWQRGGLELSIFGTYVKPSTVRLRDAELYLRPGVAFSPIGASFSARAQRKPSIFGNMGSMVFADDIATIVCLLNSTRAREIVQALNPGLHFEIDDVKRLPLLPVAHADTIYAELERHFASHESHRETSVEFLSPGSSSWRPAQAWAQRAVDDASVAAGPISLSAEDPTAASQVSFALGVALGRFDADGRGVLANASVAALPGGLLFLSAAERDSLDDPPCTLLHVAWRNHRSALGEGGDVRAYLSRSFFEDHRAVYENRPIYFPLSSRKKSFVAIVSAHRWTDATLQTLLADHLFETRNRIAGEIADLAEARTGGDKKRAREAERRFAQLQKWLEELDEFIEKVRECAEKGAPPVDSKCPVREVDAPFRMDLDDGVMINAAALWPLLEPQWKDPKKWWRELASAPAARSGVKAKDYDWAHLAKRYWPTRVDAKCKIDPSLAIAHGCFWKYHPAKAYAWELRLQHEMDEPKFTIDEEGSDGAREAFLRDHAGVAREIEEKEERRRARKGGGEEDPQSSLELEDEGPSDEEAEESA